MIANNAVDIISAWSSIFSYLRNEVVLQESFYCIEGGLFRDRFVRVGNNECFSTRLKKL